MGSSASSTTSSQAQPLGEKFVASDVNVLQKHVAFFDRNNDGIVYPWETFQGFRAIGRGFLLSFLASIFMNASFSQKTRPGKFPSLCFPVEIRNINLAKHGSDTGVYDTQGRFVSEKFEEIFRKHAHTHANALTYEELKEMLKANRVPKNYTGWVLAWGEWNLLYLLCKDNNGLLQKDTIRAVYDGALFYQMAEKNNLTIASATHTNQST